MARVISQKTMQAVWKEMNAKVEPLFTDKSGGFEFSTHYWKTAEVTTKWRNRDLAIAHRDEAIVRRVACLIEERKKEAAHWQACQAFLEVLFKIPGIGNEAE